MTIAEAVDRITADLWFATSFILAAISFLVAGWQGLWIIGLAAVTLFLSVHSRVSANRKARSRA